MNKLILRPLPYSYDTLEPVISRQIVELHHDKHQAAYVNNANTIIESGVFSKALSFNYNGAKLHEIYWENMRAPQDNNLPPGGMFENFEKFKEEFTNAAITVEGSGWAVLWKTDEGLVVGQLEKHNLMGLSGSTPILVCDVWEHSYYLDYKNDRKGYVEKWWSVVNWEDVERRNK